MSYRLLLRRDLGAVARLTMNAPERLNVLSESMLSALQDEFDLIAGQHETVRAVILNGSGRAFCAGHDLKEMVAAKKLHKDVSAYYSDLFSRCTRLMETIRKLPQPVIAEVHGVATAAGCQLVATCDLAVAANSARFGVNGIDVGLFCSTPMVALSRNIPRKQAFEMLTTGKLINADRAFELGLINKITPLEELNVETEALAETIASKLRTPVAMGKHAFYEQLQMPLDDAYDYTGNVIVQNLLQEDTQECISAFVEKRPSRI